MSILLLSRDLMLPSRLTSLARQHDCSFRTAASIDRLSEFLDQSTSQLILVDLTLPGCDPPALVDQIRKATSQARLVGFGPHVMAALLASAAAAGFDEVISNGQLEAHVVALLSAHSPDSPDSSSDSSADCSPD